MEVPLCDIQLNIEALTEDPRRDQRQTRVFHPIPCNPITEPISQHTIC